MEYLQDLDTGFWIRFIPVSDVSDSSYIEKTTELYWKKFHLFCPPEIACFYFFYKTVKDHGRKNNKVIPT